MHRGGEPSGADERFMRLQARRHLLGGEKNFRNFGKSSVSLFITGYVGLTNDQTQRTFEGQTTWNSVFTSPARYPRPMRSSSCSPTRNPWRRKDRNLHKPPFVASRRGVH